MKTKKILALALAAVLLVAVSVAGTVAYLTATTTEVVNTFKPADIQLELTESNTPWEMQLVPGTEKGKDPKVTVTTSVEAYVFVEFICSVAEGTNTLTYDFALNNANSGWSKLEDEQNIWYTTVEAGTHNWELLAGNKVSIPAEAVNADVNKGFTMTFDAWAIQKEGFDSAAAAWAQVN